MIKGISITCVKAKNLYKHMIDGEQLITEHDVVMNDSIYIQYAIKHGITVTKDNRCKDYIAIKFDKGIHDVGRAPISASELREMFYEDGVTVSYTKVNKDNEVVECNDIKYKMLMRTANKAKGGDCIFIRESLWKTHMEYLSMGLYDRMPNEGAKIVELSAYAPLITATAIDYLHIPLENILILKDRSEICKKKAAVVHSKPVEHRRLVPDYDALEKIINEDGYTFNDEKSVDGTLLKLVPKTKKSINDVTGIKVSESIKDIDWRYWEQELIKYGYAFYKDTLKQHSEYIRIHKDLTELRLLGYDDIPMRESDNVDVVNECYVEYSDEAEIENVLWDGMGIIDESLFPTTYTDISGIEHNYSGFVYCRNHFFKACLFRGNIQQFFEDHYKSDYEIATIQDMFGNIRRVKDIQIITTDKAIKWLKFKELIGNDDAEQWDYYRKIIEKDRCTFQILKTGHKSKYGDMQRGSYQIYNSLPTTDKDVLSKVAETSINYINLLKENDTEFMQYLINDSSSYKINDVLVAIAKKYPEFTETHFFKSRKNNIIHSLKEYFMRGKLFQYGDNLTVCDNPYELLVYSVGGNYCEECCFEPVGTGIQCYTTRFDFGKGLAAFRNPHNSPNNILYLINTESEKLGRYFPNLGDNVVVVNAIGTDLQNRANGMDADSDFLFVTNQEDMVRLAISSVKNFPTIVNAIPEVGSSEYTKDMNSYSAMDNTIAKNQFSTGKASNSAQLALSYYYDGGMEDNELQDAFIMLSVLAQASIDGAKRIYDVTPNREIHRINAMDCMKVETPYPQFFADIHNSNSKHPYADVDIREYNCPMDILRKCIVEEITDNRSAKEKYRGIQMVFSIDTVERKDRTKQAKKILAIVENYDSYLKKLNLDMDNEVIKEEYYTKAANDRLQKCLKEISRFKISTKTMNVLLEEIFLNDTCTIKGRLLSTLYSAAPDLLLACLKAPNKAQQRKKRQKMSKITRKNGVN